MAQKPSNTPDWIPDDSTGIIVPGGSKQTAGWFKEERPPYQFFNWFWNIVSQFIHYFSSQAEYNVTIDTIANEGDYATLAAYILAGSTPGDRVLVKVDEEITGSTMIIPANISLKFLKGKKLWCDEFALTTVLQFSDGVVTEGDLILEYCRATGTLPTAVSFNGNDNNHCNIIVKNISTGTITNAFKIEADKERNLCSGEIINESSGIINNNLTDDSGVKSNYINIRKSGSVIISTELHKNVLANISVRNWTSQSAASVSSWRAVAWSPELSLFVAVARAGTGRAMTSPNGLNWTSRTATEANLWYGITWSPELSLFAAVSIDGTNRVMTSPDGINWTAQAAAEANEWYGITWSPELSLFVAVARFGTNRVMTSPNGTTWTARAHAGDNGWYSVCWSPELSLFVAVADSGTTGHAMTSPDGTNWTTRTLANEWHSVCWSPELGLFCAVSNNAATYRVVTSPNGITWTNRTAASLSAWRVVTWSSELGIFVSTAGSGTSLMASLNGIDWTNWTAAEANDWEGLVWSPELGLFISVSTGGTNRVMRSL